MKRILILGVGCPPGVNFVNSLRYSGEQMYLVGTDVNKYHLEWPDIDKAYLSPFDSSHPEYISFINKIIEKENIEFVHAQPDCTCKVLSDNRDKINANLFLPAKRTVKICQDKFLSAQVWEKGDLHNQRSVLIKHEEDLESAYILLGTPFWLRATQGAGARGSTEVHTLSMGYYWMRYWRERKVGWQFVAQKFLPGKDFAFQSLWKDGKLIVSQARERLEYIYNYLSCSGRTGTPVVAKTVHREDINRFATNAVKMIDDKATGIFCVDLREDEFGIPHVTEINSCRFFTTSFFFTKAGVNMPYYYVKLAYGEKLPELKQYNAIEEDVYWLRHVDCPAVLKKKEVWKADEKLAQEYSDNHI